MPGYFTDRRSTGVLDALYAKAIVIEQDGSAAVFIGLDIIKTSNQLVQAIRQRVSERTAIPGERVMVSATHTHTGPAVASTTFLKKDEVYMEWLAKRAADTVELAYNDRREARIGWGSGHEADIAFHRRFWMKDGTLRTNPGIGNPDIDRPAGPIDPEVGIVRIDAADGQPIAVITNYACHTDTVGGTLYSADYPGELSAVLKKALGESVVSLFMMGASGNINHHNVNGRKELYAKPSKHYLRMGRILAGEVLKVREKIELADQVDIRERKTKLTLRYRQPTAEQIETAKRNLEQLPEGNVERNFAKELLEAARLGEGSAEAEVQAIAVGDLAVVSFPAEMFVEFGLAVKEGSPFAQTLINELANGNVGTYMCTKESYRHGGYEPRITSNNRLQEEAGELLTDGALKLLAELKTQAE